jgi:hypothetical protein
MIPIHGVMKLVEKTSTATNQLNVLCAIIKSITIINESGGERTKHKTLI